MKIFTLDSNVGRDTIAKRGPTFCQTRRINISLVWREETTLGSQKWNGTIPNFNISAIKINLIERVINPWNEEAKIITDPILWIKKYLAVEKAVWDLELIIGKNEKTPSSNLNHIKIILEDEITKKGLKNKVE